MVDQCKQQIICKHCQGILMLLSAYYSSKQDVLVSTNNLFWSFLESTTLRKIPGGHNEKDMNWIFVFWE